MKAFTTQIYISKRRKMMKKQLLIQLRKGGGYSLNPKPSIFKPIVASSLALALGMSVASADPSNPTFSADGVQSADNLKTTWQKNSEGLYELVGDPNAKLGVGMFMNGEYGTQGKFGANVVEGAFTTHEAGIQIGTLRANLYATPTQKPKTITFDFSSVGNNYALKGKLEVWGEDTPTGIANTNTFIGKFGGKGILGDIVFKTAAKAAQLSFLNEANLEGNIILQKGTVVGGSPSNTGSTNTFSFGNGGIKGSIVTTGDRSYSNTFSFDSQRTADNPHISKGILIANGGGRTQTFVFTSTKKSEVIISGKLKDTPFNANNYSGNLSGGEYAIVVQQNTPKQTFPLKQVR